MPALSMTIYLLKSSVTDPVSVVRENADLLFHDFQVADLNGVFFARPPDPHPTDWLDFVEPIANGVLDGAQISSMGCLAITCVSGRYFALSFGTGWTFLEPHTYERDFGLRVVVNAIDPGQLRALDARSLGVVALDQRMQTSRRTTLTDFGMNIDRDMLTGVTGNAQNASVLGSTVTGRDSLKIRREIGWEDVKGLLEELLDLWESDTYRANSFDWIDHFGVVRDHSLVLDLERSLMQGIQSGDLDNIYLTVPEVIDWDSPTFKYQKKKAGQPHPDVDWKTYLEFLTSSGKSPSIELIKRQSIHCFMGDAEEPIHSWTVFRCLYVELEHSDKTYVLSGGAWYGVASEYIDSVNQDVQRIPECALPLARTSCGNEDKYIDDHCGDNGPGFKQLHRRSITHGGGHGSIEFCDLMSHDNHLVHIKRHKANDGPDPLSHLFSQGIVSSQLMMSDQEFRRKVNAKLESLGLDHAFVPHTDRLNGPDWELVYVIIHPRRRTNESLPLMSRINLRNAASRVRALGMGVSTLHVTETSQEQAGTQA
jgi:uncharacterized protein (TIGR04141 family)